MQIRESAENYLEAILILSQKNESVRSVDVASYMGFSKPSISIAMKSLRESGYINVEKNGDITLNASGYDVAAKIYERHCCITEMLQAMGVKQETAISDACKIEHVISEESFECIKRYFDRHKK